MLAIIINIVFDKIENIENEIVYTREWFSNLEVSDIHKNLRVKQVTCFIITKDKKLLLVSKDGSKWSVTAGHYEASQVSIAQAFPAILRAKKILVLGDQRQFSNVKANQAKSDTNQDYLNKLNNVYRKNVSTDPSELVKLGKFNIKTSVLEFFEFISNFNTQLTKHFRGYKELISYSNKFFYQNNLQVMKIRAKKIDEVLKFTQLEVDEESEIPNTNIGEIEFIISQLEEVYKKQ